MPLSVKTFSGKGRPSKKAVLFRKTFPFIRVCGVADSQTGRKDPQIFGKVFPNKFFFWGGAFPNPVVVLLPPVRDCFEETKTNPVHFSFPGTHLQFVVDFSLGPTMEREKHISLKDFSAKEEPL